MVKPMIDVLAGIVQVTTVMMQAIAQWSEVETLCLGERAKNRHAGKYSLLYQVR